MGSETAIQLPSIEAINRLLVIARSGDDVLWAAGPTVPVDASTGYVKGAIFIQSDGTAGAVFYINEGTKASSDFNVAL
jgi:hypothetical protein